jgi:hypothetical protein
VADEVAAVFDAASVEGKVEGRRKIEHNSAAYPEKSPDVDEPVLVEPEMSATKHKASTANVAFRALMVCFRTSSVEILPFA